MITSTNALTPSQTVGPFFANCLLRADACCAVLRGPVTRGDPIRIEGRVLDGDGVGVPDALIEIWQANSGGRYNHPADKRDVPLDPDFTGYGRTGTAADGTYRFDTIKPGAVPFDSHQMQAPHIGITVFARGLLNHLFTRLYFADSVANTTDPILLHVPAERRMTLMAAPTPADGYMLYRLNIVLQGERETVFFNL